MASLNNEGEPGRDWQDPPRYTLEDLNAAYNQYLYAPNREQLMARWGRNSAEAVARMGEPRVEPYGAEELEKLEIFRARADGAPIQIHFRGGGWRHLPPRREHAFVGETFVGAGAHFILPDFDGIDRNGGQLMPIATQVRNAVAWVYRNADRFGGDRERIFVSGHSTGAHLASVVATTDWQETHGLPRDIVKGTVCSSGVYDLAPAGLSGRFPALRLDNKTVAELGTMRHVDRLAAPIVVTCASLETPGFIRQFRDFAAALVEADKSATTLVADGYNHLEILETLANPHGLLGRLALGQMGLLAA